MSDNRTLLWVEWVDSSSHGGVWTNKDALLHQAEAVQSVGWLVSECEENLTIAAHWGQWQVGGDMTIPKVAIVQRWEIVL